MNPENTGQAAPEPSRPAAKPVFIGNTSIVDRSNQANIYPEAKPPGEPSSDNSSPKLEKYQRVASASFAEAIVLICGFGSTAGWMLSAYFLHNAWIDQFVAFALAGLAIYFAHKEYRASQRLSPWFIIGLVGATLTLLILADYWLARLLIHSLLSGLSGNYNY